MFICLYGRFNLANQVINILPLEKNVDMCKYFLSKATMAFEIILMNDFKSLKKRFYFLELSVSL